MNENFMKSKVVIVSFLESVESEDFGDKKVIFKELCTKLFSDFEDLENDKVVLTNEEDILKCRKLLEFLRDIYFEIPISKNLIEFSINFAILVFNWNQNLSKDDTIFMLSEKVKLTYEEKYTLIELLNQSKRVLHMLKHQSNYTFVPELSKHYLKTFCDKEDMKK